MPTPAPGFRPTLSGDQMLLARPTALALPEPGDPLGDEPSLKDPADDRRQTAHGGSPFLARRFQTAVAGSAVAQQCIVLFYPSCMAPRVRWLDLGRPILAFSIRCSGPQVRYRAATATWDRPLADVAMVWTGPHGLIVAS